MEQLLSSHPAFQDDYDQEWPTNIPQRSQEEIQQDIEFFVNHPLNATKLTPEMLERPEFQALAALAYDGTPEEIAKNFCNHGYDYLNKVVTKESKNQQQDIEQALYCFDEGLDQKECKDKELIYQLLMGRAKTNILIGQFGKTKEDCMEAKKYKETVQLYAILARSRIFVERYKDAVDYCNEGLKKFADSPVLKSILQKAQEESKKEIKRVDEIATIQNHQKDQKLEVYRNLRGKKVKIGKRIHYLPEIVEVNITVDSQGYLHFPVLLLYDEYMATDFIKDWREDQTLKDQLTQVFAEQAPWDEQNKYRLDTIEVYFEADSTTPLDPKDKAKEKSNKKYVKCSMESTLLEVLQHKLHIVPQYPVLKIICKNTPFREAFLNEI